MVSRAEIPGKPWLVQPGNREWVTTIECINSSGWSIPSTIIFKEKRYIEGWFEELSIPPARRVVRGTSKAKHTDLRVLNWPFL